ncbi:hypothetical protein LZ24_02601 [Desulfobotulus alkaliphilus]|uniref:Cell division protein ZapB n=1 Tax=Desulfobotulus alkaliphilus TaxID=622671 RepID=A0A562RIN1_9BACT|nr:hypothetical protein [Desulfobotulus alkaliphilus]TWI68226.1 hypothetical protein LZ24_02601 [Desulfobotulus alkaliphilus]
MEREVVLNRFDAIESKVERLLAHCKALEEERDALKVELADINALLEDMMQKESERVQDEEAMQKKIDALLEKLDAF